MSRFVLGILNMGLSASWLILAVMIVRFILRKVPKWINMLLWGIVALRLLCPFSIESAFSLVPSAQPIPNTVLTDSGFVLTGQTEQSGQPEQTKPDDSLLDMSGANRDKNQDFRNGPALQDSAVHVMDLLTAVWLTGAFVLIAYSAFGYFRLRRQLGTAVRLRENIYQSERIHSAFVLGLFRPRIFVPFQMSGQCLEYVVLHEQAHIRRLDHIWKLTGVVLLAVYWFHPLIWLSYVLLCRDMEMACDERVVRKLGRSERADYSQALLACSIKRRSIAACPLAFGEVGIKERVKSVLHYKKPAFWMIAAAVAVCVAVAVCFLTNPAGQAASSQDADGQDDGGQDADGQDDGGQDADGQGDGGQDAGGQDGDNLPDGQDAENDGGQPGQSDGIVWEAADLDHDGEAESIRVRETSVGEVYELEVLKKDGTVLWSAEAGLPHTGWNCILLYERDGEDYLIEYRPVTYQGMANYTCRIFSLEGGAETEADSRSLDFTLPVWLISGEMRGFAESVNWWLQESTVLLSTLQGVLVVGPAETADVPEVYPVVLDPDETDHPEGRMEMPGEGLPEEVLPLQFMFASGAGGWSTTLTLHPDGSFEGEYEAFYPGSSEYPNGESYFSRFSGRFGGITRVSEFACVMQMEEISYETEPGKEWTEDGVHYISTEPYGLEGRGEYIFYMPGTPIEGLDEELFNWWPDRTLGREGTLRTLSSYALYNAETGQAFFTSHLQ